MNKLVKPDLASWQQAITAKESWSLSVKVIVNCQRLGWQGQLADGSWKIGLAEPAVDNRANEALLIWLSKELACPVSQLRIVAGRTSRRKIVRLIN